MAVKLIILAVSLCILLQVIDVSAQCTITPLNPTSLTATSGTLVNGTTDVRIQCVCRGTNDDQRVRWYDINSKFLVQSGHTSYVTGSPYLMLNNPGATNVTLVIPTFTDSYDGTYNCGIRVNDNQFTSPSAAVTLTIAPCTITPLNPTTLTVTGGAVVSGTTNVMIQCVCTVTSNQMVRWYNTSKDFITQDGHPRHVDGSPYFIPNNPNGDTDVTLVIPTLNDFYNGTYYCGIFVNDTAFTSPSAAVTLTIGCPSLNDPSNGMISCSMGGDGVPGNVGGTCTYTCNTGYVLTNSNTRTCQSDGNWSGSAPMCNRTCPVLDDPSNGMVTCSLGGDGVPDPGDTCTYTCNTGYVLTNSNTRTCQSDGSWSNSALMCTRVSCPALNDPSNGMIDCTPGDAEMPFYQDTCTYTCNTDYLLNGSNTTTCQSDRSWSNNAPTCRRLTVSIVSNPDGTPVSGSTNTFDYPILSSVNLTCNVAADDGLPVTVTSYQWNTAGCYNHPKRNNGNPTCFPDGQTSQNVTGIDITAADAGTITCTVTISGSDFTSGPFTLRITGIALIEVMPGDNAVVSTNAINDYSYVNARGTNDVQLTRCATGLGPNGTDMNTAIGGVYFNGNRIPDVGCSDSLSPIVRLQSGSFNNVVGVIQTVQCREFSTAAEGIYTCIMMNSSMMSESIRFGVYFTGRTAPVIDTPSSSTVTLPAGSPLNLNCTSQGSPPDTFTWRKDGGSILQSITNQLTYTSTSAVFRADYSIDSVTTSDSGTYTCTVTNPIGSDSATITVVVTSVEPPTNVRVIVLTPRSVEVTWNPSLSPGISSYLISYTTNASYTIGGSISVDGATISHTLTNLEEGTLYNITVQATNSSGTSPNSNEVSVTTYTDAPNSSPLNVMVTSVNPASLEVSWQPPLEINWNGPIVHVIQYTRIGLSNTMSENVNSGTTHTISELVAYVDYSVRVAAMNVNGTGPFSNPVIEMSGEDVPSKPQLEMVSVNSSSVTLQWSPPNPPNGVITQYSIQSNKTVRNDLNSSVRMYTIGQLPSDTVYVLQLTASTSVGEGLPSTVTIITAPRPVSNVAISNDSVSSSALTLTWMETSLTNSKLSHYTVFYLPLRGPYDSIMTNNRRKRQSAQAKELTMNFTGTTGNLTNLHGAVTYRIQVAAVSTFNGQNVTGDRSPPIEMMTLVGVPTAPQNLNYTNLISNGVMFNVTLTWSRPNPPNGIITQYNVSYVDTNSQGSNSDIQNASITNSTESSYTWTNLIQGNYQFSVVAYTSKGSGEAASLMLDTLPSPDTSSDDGGGSSAGAIAGGVIGGLFAAALIIIVVIVIVIFLRRYRDKTSYQPDNYKKPEKDNVSLEDISDGISCEPKIIGLPAELRAIEGQSFSFPSHVTGKPAPDVYWYLNSRDMTEDDVVVISSNGQLTLTSVSEDHEGDWRCQATNSSGSTEAQTRLVVTPSKTTKPLPSPRPDRKHKPIPVNEFGTHVTMLHENNNQGFKAEYESFYNGEGMSTAIGVTPANKHKNRFANIVAYDENRVVLGPCGAFKDDYINASPLDGYKHPRCFIAAQAPVAKTVADFWRLVWQEHPPTIVMVTNLKEGEKVKCVQYWPDAVGQSQTYGPLKVCLTEEFEFADYVVRSIQLENSELGNHIHMVTQYHFTAWPDHGVPEYATAVLAFHRRLRGTHQASIGPMLVHCSAGVGRTGTLITVDVALEQIKAEGVVGIYNVVDKLRHQRPHMVQSQEQYMFIHDAILESITCGNTQVSAADLQRAVTKLKQRDSHAKLTGYEQQFKVLEQVSPRVEDQVCTSALKYPEKNRPNHCNPLEKGRVILRKERADYINASFLKGYKQDKAFIVAQSPMKNTIRDFWKMIHDRQCASVVMLCETIEDGREACAAYWPESGTFTYDDMTVTSVSAVEAKEFTTRMFKVTDKGSNTTHQVTQFHFHGWSAHKTPASAAGLITLIDEVQRVQRSTANKPIVVHCSNVLGRTGTFCAIFTILDRFKVEQVIDVLQTVKLLRIKRPGIVEDLDQYQFIFTVVVRFLQSFDTYDNFKM